MKTPTNRIRKLLAYLYYTKKSRPDPNLSGAVMLFILTFKFRGTTREDILEMRAKKREKELKERQKALNNRKKS